MISKRMLVSSVAVVVIGSALAFGAGQAHAQISTDTSPFTKLAQLISQKFGLDQSQVQTVVDQFHTERRGEMQAKMLERFEEKLMRLVADGKITDVQKQAIIAKHTELKNKYDSEGWKSMTVDERKEKMQQMHGEFTSWAKTQGIDETALMPGFGMGGMHRMGKWM